MAAPTWVAASAGAVDTAGAWTFTCAAPGAAGRLILVHIFQDGTGTGVTGDMVGTNITAIDGTANTWTRLKSSAPAVFGVGATGSQVGWHNVWAGRSTGTSAPTISGDNAAGDDLYFRAYEFLDANAGAALSDVFENGAIDMDASGSGLEDQATSNSVSNPGITTNGPDRLAVIFIAAADDVTIASYTGESGGDLALATAAFTTATGTDASIALQIAAMAPAGSITGGTAALGASIGWSAVGFAIIGTTVAAADRVPRSTPYPQLLSH